VPTGTTATRAAPAIRWGAKPRMPDDRFVNANVSS
jgi:hypothetical protein